MRSREIFVGLCVVLGPFAGIRDANAEFQLIGPGVSITPSREPPTDRPSSPPRSVLRPADQAVVAGFGTQVPLAFATRQIVPSGVKTAFGEDLDPETLLVDWTGGRPWPDVLRTMLRPVGLQVTFRPGSVLIERGSGS